MIGTCFGERRTGSDQLLNAGLTTSYFSWPIRRDGENLRCQGKSLMHPGEALRIHLVRRQQLVSVPVRGVIRTTIAERHVFRLPGRQRALATDRARGPSSQHVGEQQLLCPRDELGGRPGT